MDLVKKLNGLKHNVLLFYIYDGKIFSLFLINKVPKNEDLLRRQFHLEFDFCWTFDAVLIKMFLLCLKLVIYKKNMGISTKLGKFYL